MIDDIIIERSFLLVEKKIKKNEPMYNSKILIKYEKNFDDKKELFKISGIEMEKRGPSPR